MEFLGEIDVGEKYLYGFRRRPEKYVEKESVEDYFIDKSQEVWETPCLSLKWM